MKICKTTDCLRAGHDHKSWDSGEYCKECFRRIEESADALHNTIKMNRSLGLNDSGSMTRFVNGTPTGDPNAKGDIDYGRGDTWVK